MRALLVILCVIPLCVQAEYLVYKLKENEQISKRIVEGPITLKRRLLPDLLITYRDLGKRLTPYYYQSQGSFHAIYESFNYGLIRLTVGQTVFAQRWKNSNKLELKIQGYEDFQYISQEELKQNVEFEMAWNQRVLRKSIEGFSFHYFLRDIYMDEQNAPNLDWFSFEFSEDVKVINSKKEGFKLVKNITFHREKYHFYSPRKKEVISELKYDARDFLFTNHNGEYLFVKRYQPHPLDFRYLTIRDGHQEYLNQLENNLFDYKGKKVCYMDYAIDHSKYDCENNALNNDNYLQYKKFNFIKIDLNKNEIEVQ